MANITLEWLLDVTQTPGKETLLEHNSSANSSVQVSVNPTPVYIMTWVTILNILIFVTGVFGNVLVIFVVSRVREMKTPTNYCLMNLSIADLLVLLICQPAALLEFYGHEKWLLGDVMCRLTVFLENFVTHASISIILCVSFGRYFAVTHPLQAYSTGSKSKALILMVVIWIVVFAITSPFLKLAHTKEEYHYLDQAYVQVCITVINEDWKRVYMVITFCTFFVLPFCTLVFLYTVIIYRVVRNTIMSGDVKDSAKVQSKNSETQVVIMLVGIIILFFFCLLPFRIIALYQIFTPVSKFKTMGLEVYLNVMSFVRILIYANSAGNPIIYNIFSQKFRKAFRKALLCKKRNELSNAMRRTTVTNYSYVKSDMSQVDYV